MTTNKITMQDEYEAKSRRYSNDVVILLELSNGNIAVFNNARTLTGVIDGDIGWFLPIKEQHWHKPSDNLVHTTTIVDKNDLTPIPSKPLINLQKVLRNIKE